MKKIYLIAIFSVLFGIKGFGQIWLSGITTNPTAPSTCDNVTAIITGTLQCGNSTITVDSIQYSGNRIKVFLNEFTPGICLPIILPFSQPVSIGYLPFGNDTIEALLYKNGVYTENLMHFLTVANAGNNFSQNQNICAGDSAFIAGKWRKNSGNYVDTIAGISCDTFITTQLTVGGFFNDSNKVNICAGDSVYLGDRWQSTPGIYADTFQIGSGCDSIVLTNLRVGISKIQNRNLTICQGQGVFAGGKFTDVPGNYADTFITFLGCDSIIYTSLSVNKKDTTSQDPIICQGETFFAGGQNRTFSGTYYDYLTNKNSCDSLVVTNLTVNPSYLKNIFDTLCQGDSILFGGKYVFSGGLFDDTLNTIFGCDSVQRLLVTVLEDTTTKVDTSVCKNDSLRVNGQLVFTSGEYHEFYVANNGCDSIVSFNVSVDPSDSTFVDTTLFQGDSLFVGGAFQQNAGVYFDKYFNVFGCDSTIKTTITIEIPKGVFETAGRGVAALFPNPNNGLFNLNAEKQISKLQVFDVMGREVKTILPFPQNGQIKIKHPGIYYLTISFDDGTFENKKVFVLE